MDTSGHLRIGRGHNAFWAIAQADRWYLKKDATQTLRTMERNGLVQRVVYPVVPPVVEYSLTPLGQTLREPMEVLRSWAYGHLQEVAEAQTTYDQRDHTPLHEATASLVQQR